MFDVLTFHFRWKYHAWNDVWDVCNCAISGDFLMCIVRTWLILLIIDEASLLVGILYISILMIDMTLILVGMLCMYKVHNNYVFLCNLSSWWELYACLCIWKCIWWLGMFWNCSPFLKVRVILVSMLMGFEFMEMPVLWTFVIGENNGVWTLDSW